MAWDVLKPVFLFAKFGPPNPGSSLLVLPSPEHLTYQLHPGAGGLLTAKIIGVLFSFFLISCNHMLFIFGLSHWSN